MEAIGHKEALQTSSLCIFFILNLMKYFPSYAAFLAILPILCSRCAHVLDSQWAFTLSIFMEYIPKSSALSIK